MPEVYLIPSYLSEDSRNTIPAYVLSALQQCEAIFAENERTARRYLRSMDSGFPIDRYEWFTIEKEENSSCNDFKRILTEGKNVAIISEAGCPGIADPGQVLVKLAQQLNFPVKPLVGPNSIILALMASGFNGQHFEFLGYLPIDSGDRIKKIKEMEQHSSQTGSTKIFIETPYRNNQLLEALLTHCLPSTRICIGKNLTGKDEWIISLSVAEWKKNKPELHKIPVIFLLQS